MAPMERPRARAILLAVLLVLASSGLAAAAATSRIKTVVVLMMENRSFDHLLGWLGPQVDGLTGNEFNLRNTSDPSSERVYVSDKAEYVDPDPGHSFSATKEQIYGGTTEAHLAQDPPPMSGFAQQAESKIPGFSQRVMAAFRPSAIPTTAALATQFAVFDRWFSSIPGPTQPNRFFVHSATSHGATANLIPDLLMGFPQRTIFDDLDAANKTFGIYFHDVPSTLFFSRLRTFQHGRRFHWFDQFKDDARAGTLPSYTVLEPRYFDLWGYPANDDHPSHDLSEGQFLLKDVYESLRASPQWNETLLIITYDEHGGFFDHVPTPTKGVPSPDGIAGKGDGFQFNRLGVRVPTILVSPWIDANTVVHAAEGPQASSQYEHSSIPATVRKLMGLSPTPLTQREAWAGTFDWLVNRRDTPRTDCPETMPSPTRPLRHSPPNENALLTEWQQELVQMSATLGHNDSSTGTSKEAQGLVRASVRRRLAATVHLSVKQGSGIARREVTRFLPHLRV